MRKLLAALSVLAVLAPASPALAGQEEPLGRGSLALKFGVGVFTADELEDTDHSTFVELEGYYRVAPAVYLGASVGTTFVDESFLSTTEVDFAPVELNVKYAREISPRLVVDGGGGLSFSRVKVHETNYFGPDVSESDWLAGGQLFGDLTWKFGWFSMGIFAKYQVTEEFESTVLEADFSNFRGGLQVGAIFR